MSHTRLSSALFTKNCPARTKPPPMIELTIDSTAFEITPIPLSEPRRRLSRERVSGPAWARQRTRERSARTSFQCIGRRRSRPRRRRRFECCSSFVHCELAGCDVRARLISRSCGSFRPTRPAHHRPRHRTGHDGPPLRLPYASASASPAFADLLLFLNGLLATGVNGTNGTVDRDPACADGRVLVLPDSRHPSGRRRPNQGSRSDREHARVMHYVPVSSLLTAVRGQL